MPQVINTNIMSLNSQRNLNTSQTAMQVSLQRLSSGLRINSAKDDAAGLAISERFTTQIRGLNQAVRNANDGISLAQTAEGALAEMNQNLQRIRELAVQSANATNSVADRAALDQEVQQRIAEIERVAGQTSFNGQKILDGTFGNAAFQVGANVGETINLNLTSNMRASNIGQIATKEGVAVTNAALAVGDVEIAVGRGDAVKVGTSVDGKEVGQAADSAYAKAVAINAAGVEGLTVSAKTEKTLAYVDVKGATIGNGTGFAEGSYKLEINGELVADLGLGENGDAVTAQQVVEAINNNADVTGVSAELVGGEIKLTAEDGRNIGVKQTIALGTAGTTGGVAGSGSGLAGGNVTHYGTVELSASENIKLTGSGLAKIGFGGIDQVSKDTTTLATMDVKSVENSNETIRRVDAALAQVSGLRSTFGAIQNRFESTIANLSTTSENLEASRSRILDTDFAAETANLARAQILQQAGVAMLAQANQLPQNVLSLLR